MKVRSSWVAIKYLADGGRHYLTPRRMRMSGLAYSNPQRGWSSSVLPSEVLKE
jgi:hypothetical protein